MGRIGYLDTDQFASDLGVSDVQGRSVGNTADPNSLVNVGTGNTSYVRQGQTATWSPATGTADRSGYAAYISPTISNPPTQAEVQAVSDALQALSQHVVALINDLEAIAALKT